MSSGHLTVCIVGAGPRGLSVLERICANERKSASHPTVTVHVVDAARPGPGRVWRTDQSPHLLMNTVASQVTVYTDGSVTMNGPIEDGPSLYEWAKSLCLTGDPAAQATGPDGRFRTEAAGLGPDSYPSRALYGRYLEDVFAATVSRAPAHVTVVEHRARAVALDDTPAVTPAETPDGTPAGPPGSGTQVLTLADGTRIAGLDAVVLAQGHVPAATSPDEERLTRESRAHGLLHVLPANPADVDLTAVRPGQGVLLRGLGLNFFDHMALFTLGRGGTFERAGDRLVYRASGREPRLYAGSRRGIPYHARGENEKGATGRHLPALLTPEAIALLHRRSLDGERLHFGSDLWPLIAKEVESVYYGTLLTARGERAEAEEFTGRYLAAPAGAAEHRLLDEYAVTPGERWDWEAVSRPYGTRFFADRAEFRGWLLGHLAQDVRDARAGNVSGPVKAALDVLRDLRNEIRIAVDHGRLEGNSYRDDLHGWYTPLNAFLSIGPPVSRIEEMIALLEAGVLDVLGPGMSVHIVEEDGDAFFEAASDRAGGAPVRASVLVEARLPEPDVRRTADPLLGHLLATGQARAYRIDGVCGTSYETGGLAVTERPYRLVDAQGRAHPRRFAYGVPTEAVHWVTAAGIRPGVDSVTLGDSDALARTVLNLGPVPGSAPAPEAPDSDFTEVMA